MPSFQELKPGHHAVLRLPTLAPNDIRLNIYFAPLTTLATGPEPLPSIPVTQLLCFDAALVNELLHCAWFSSGALEAWR